MCLSLLLAQVASGSVTSFCFIVNWFLFVAVNFIEPCVCFCRKLTFCREFYAVAVFLGPESA